MTEYDYKPTYKVSPFLRASPSAFLTEKRNRLRFHSKFSREILRLLHRGFNRPASMFDDYEDSRQI
jgi:hypothetical protein